MKIIRKMGILLLVALTLVMLCSSALAAGQQWIVEWPDGTKKEFATKEEAKAAMNAEDAAVEVRDYKTDQNGQIILPVQYAAYAKSLGLLIPFEQWHVVETVPSGYEAVGSTTTHFAQGDIVTIKNVKVTPTPTETPAPTETPDPTETPAPTATPSPTVKPTRSPVVNPKYPFTFTKVWHGEASEAVQFTLYTKDGTVYKTYTANDMKKKGDTWTKTVYLDDPANYYMQEIRMMGYQLKYENNDPSVTDRCLNGGTIVNVKIPETGDSASLPMYLALAITAIALTVALQKKHRHQQ